MISLSELEVILITCLPALTSILSIIAAVVSVIRSLGKLKDNESLKSERDDLKQQNAELIRECRAMRKQISLYIQKVTQIHYNDLTEVRNDKELQI